MKKKGIADGIVDKTVMASRITSLRLSMTGPNGKCLTQEEFGRALSDFCESSDIIAPVTISAYENGRRIPPVSTLVGMSKFFGVSVDYLLGVDAPAKKAEIIEDDDSPLVKPDLKIRPQDYEKYDGQPVFLTAPDGTLQNRWVIMDYKKDRLVCPDAIYAINPQFTLYKMQPIEAIYTDIVFRKPCTMQSMREASVVWVEMLSFDPYVKGKYNGWYRHNEDNSMLINIANSLVLTYEGIGISYNAYNIK